MESNKPKRPSIVCYTETLSTSLCVPAVPLTLWYGFWDDEKDAIVVDSLPVLAIVANRTRAYSRFKRDENDYGKPYDPPTAKSLVAEGYRYVGESTEFDYLVACEDGPYRVSEYCEGNAHYVGPTEGGFPESRRKDFEDQERSKKV